MKDNMSKPFRDLASFGKRMEYKIIAEMLLEDLDIYMPLVDDDAVDAVVGHEPGHEGTPLEEGLQRDSPVR